MLLFAFLMPIIIVGMQVQARRSERDVSEVVADHAQIDITIRHVRPRAVAQLVRRSAL